MTENTPYERDKLRVPHGTGRLVVTLGAVVVIIAACSAPTPTPNSTQEARAVATRCASADWTRYMDCRATSAAEYRAGQAERNAARVATVETLATEAAEAGAFRLEPILSATLTAEADR